MDICEQTAAPLQPESRRRTLRAAAGLALTLLLAACATAPKHAPAPAPAVTSTSAPTKTAPAPTPAPKKTIVAKPTAAATNGVTVADATAFPQEKAHAKLALAKNGGDSVASAEIGYYLDVLMGRLKQVAPKNVSLTR
ncbi:MAG TPA: hypothetical protein VF132_06425, partial [Rudaea sp.]